MRRQWHPGSFPSPLEKPETGYEAKDAHQATLANDEGCSYSKEFAE